MGDKSKIEWCDATWNVVTGCSPVSEGCKHCYARRNWARLSANPKTVYFGRNFSDVRCHPEKLKLPLQWKKKPRRIFVNSMSDLFHPDVSDDFIYATWLTMAITPQHTYLILTKRPERMRAILQSWIDYRATFREGATGESLPNVWLGVTAENQKAADERIPVLLKTPAAHRFVSIEPMLGPIDLSDLAFWVDESGKIGASDGRDNDVFPDIHCVIVGCESGPNRRTMNLDWARSVKDQCHDARVPFFMKQLSVNGKVENDIELFPDDLRLREQ
jgi:protein gp37